MLTQRQRSGVDNTIVRIIDAFDWCLGTNPRTHDMGRGAVGASSAFTKCIAMWAAMHVGTLAQSQDKNNF